MQAVLLAYKYIICRSVKYVNNFFKFFKKLFSLGFFQGFFFLLLYSRKIKWFSFSFNNRRKATASANKKDSFISRYVCISFNKWKWNFSKLTKTWQFFWSCKSSDIRYRRNAYTPLLKNRSYFFISLRPADPRLLEFFGDFLLLGGCFFEKPNVAMIKERKICAFFVLFCKHEDRYNE